MTRRPGGFGLGFGFGLRLATLLAFVSRQESIHRARRRGGVVRVRQAQNPRRDRAPRLLLLLRSFVFFQTLGVHGRVLYTEVRPRRRTRRELGERVDERVHRVVAQRRLLDDGRERALVVGVRRRVRGQGPDEGRRERVRAVPAAQVREVRRELGELREVFERAAREGRDGLRPTQTEERLERLRAERRARPLRHPLQQSLRQRPGEVRAGG